MNQELITQKLVPKTQIFDLRLHKLLLLALTVIVEAPAALRRSVPVVGGVAVGANLPTSPVRTCLLACFHLLQYVKVIIDASAQTFTPPSVRRYDALQSLISDTPMPSPPPELNVSSTNCLISVHESGIQLRNSKGRETKGEK